MASRPSASSTWPTCSCVRAGSSRAGFWIFVLPMGALGGLILWWMAGWWFALRLRWAGATNPPRRDARLVMTYSMLVVAGPTVVMTLLEMIGHQHYAEAYAAVDYESFVMLAFGIIAALFAFFSEGPPV